MHSKIFEIFQLEYAFRVLLTQGLEEDGEEENQRWGRFFPISGTGGFMIFEHQQRSHLKIFENINKPDLVLLLHAGVFAHLQDQSLPRYHHLVAKKRSRGFIFLFCLCFQKKHFFNLPLFQLSSLAMSLSVICKNK